VCVYVVFLGYFLQVRVLCGGGALRTRQTVFIRVCTWLFFFSYINTSPCHDAVNTDPGIILRRLPSSINDVIDSIGRTAVIDDMGEVVRANHQPKAAVGRNSRYLQRQSRRQSSSSIVVVSFVAAAVARGVAPRLLGQTADVARFA